MQGTLAIITDVYDRFNTCRYLAQLMIPEWQRMGFRVVIVNAEGPFEPAEIAILHPDLSIDSPEILALTAQYGSVVNGAVHDIRKSHFSSHLVTQEDHYDGPVIVKTTWNAGGRHDLKASVMKSECFRKLAPLGLQALAWPVVGGFDRLRPWATRATLDASQYRIYPHPREVPGRVWSNSNFVVEKFLSERKDTFYSCRHWLFFGKQEISRRSLSNSPIVKGGSVIEPLDEEVPPKLMELRRKLGFDYGKFDYSIVDGEVVLYDVNRTPGLSRHLHLHRTTAMTLAAGIHTFLPDHTIPL